MRQVSTTTTLRLPRLLARSGDRTLRARTEATVDALSNVPRLAANRSPQGGSSRSQNLLSVQGLLSGLLTLRKSKRSRERGPGPMAARAKQAKPRVKGSSYSRTA